MNKEPSNVHYIVDRMPPLDKQQEQYFHSQAAYWEEVREMAQKQVEFAIGQRALALEMLGMIPEKGGYPE